MICSNTFAARTRESCCAAILESEHIKWRTTVFVIFYKISTCIIKIFTFSDFSDIINNVLKRI